MTAREFLQRHNNIELLKLINEVYEDSSETEPMVTMMQSNQLEVFSLQKVRGEISYEIFICYFSINFMLIILF